jgi:hypothetical protein
MTSHAQPISTPPGQLTSGKRSRKRDSIGADKRKGDGEGNSLSIAKMGLIGAVVTAAAPIVIAVMHSDSSGGANSPGQTITPPPPQASAPGSFDQVAINESGTEVTVTGSAEKDVDNVVVLIGPRQSGGQYWAASANVVNQQWKLVVATDPHVPVPYQIKAYYRQHEKGADYRQRAGTAAIRSASYFTFQQATPTPTPNPTPPAGSIVNCAEKYGDSCFNGPGWGPPSIYQSDH